PIQNTFTAQYSTGFVTKLSPDSRTILFSTYLGGSGYSDSQGKIQVDSDDSFYVFGYTYSPDFPVKNAVQPMLRGIGDPTVSKFSPKGELIFATYFGGPGQGTGRLAPDGTLVLAGVAGTSDFPLVNPIQTDAAALPFGAGYLAKMSHDGQKVLYSTFVG